MAKQDKISMPSSMGGIVRYFDEYKSKIELSPQTVLILGVLLVLLVGLILPLLS